MLDALMIVGLVATFADGAFSPVERGIYRMACVDPSAEQSWQAHAISPLDRGGVLTLVESSR